MKSRIKYFIIALLSFLSITSVAQITNAANSLGFRWVSNTATVQNNTASYYYSFLGAAQDYNNNTDLVINTSGAANIIAWEGSYGDTGWLGLASPYANGNPCGCGWDVNRANFAYIYFNTYYGTPGNLNHRARHELGHVFGLDHQTCAVSSVMQPTQSNCQNAPTYIQPDEVNWINYYY